MKVKYIINAILMTNEPSSEAHSDKELSINAICINCNNRFTSMRGISMHLKVTAARHAVNFLSYGNCDVPTFYDAVVPMLIFMTVCPIHSSDV
jgi:hypothetical protein